jgi:predicted GIY-YIG superfamily endonuclease
MKKRIYAVVHGRVTGMFNSWEGGAREQVDGFSGAVYKAFASAENAELWWHRNSQGAAPTYHFPRPDIQDEVQIADADLREISTDAPYVVYLIIDPRDGCPFYVGQTGNLERRRKGHLRVSLGNKLNRKQKRLLEIIQAGREPIFITVEGFSTQAEALIGETRWVKACARRGHAVYSGWREHKEIVELHLPT